MSTNTELDVTSLPEFRCPRANPVKYNYPPLYPFPPPRDPGDLHCRPIPPDGLFPPDAPKPFSWPQGWPWPPTLKSQASNDSSSGSVPSTPSALTIALYVSLAVSILVIVVTLLSFWCSRNHTSSKRMTWAYSRKNSKIPFKQSLGSSITIHVNESDDEFLRCFDSNDNDENAEGLASDRVQRHPLPHRLPMFVNNVFILPSPPRSIALNELRIVNGSVIGTPGFTTTDVAKTQNLSALSLVMQGE
ncbi:hypothetical protein HDU77_007316 [Chytriomyces hyalinus]|nr:hypothetical protein HDU77_007316 [Chytriomyces hyalinus]